MSGGGAGAGGRRRASHVGALLALLVLAVYLPAARNGFVDLDEMTSGLQKGDLVIVAARPAMGKTSFCLNIAQHVAMRVGQTVGLFSLEMSKEQLALRLLCADARIDRVFLTGGSALVPAVRHIFERRFGGDKLRGGEELTSVASGLALRAASD